MTKKNITIDDLAEMIKKGFDKTATIERVDDLEKWATGKFDAVDKRFDAVDKRFDKIEKLLIAEDRKRLDKLESRVDYLENMLALPAKK